MMRQPHSLSSPARSRLQPIPIWAATLLCISVLWSRADQIEMQNGDRYFGKVLSLTSNTLVLQSDVLGTVTLPRDKVSNLALGVRAPTNSIRSAFSVSPQPPRPAGVSTNKNGDLAASLRRLGANTNLIQQVQSEFLADADPAAKNKFNEMVSGLMSGKLTVNDIRIEAKSAVDQVRALRRDLGEDAGPALDGYLAILDNFLRETAPAAHSPTNGSGAPPKPKLGSAGDDE